MVLWSETATALALSSSSSSSGGAGGRPGALVAADLRWCSMASCSASASAAASETFN
uniref:Uncharacterized protein n=1 Tax=Arundo donax TaxID=35708 RepID=A0A0A9GC91_ARUDO